MKQWEQNDNPLTYYNGSPLKLNNFLKDYTSEDNHELYHNDPDRILYNDIYGDMNDNLNMINNNVINDRKVRKRKTKNSSHAQQYYIDKLLYPEFFVNINEKSIRNILIGKGKIDFNRFNYYIKSNDSSKKKNKKNIKKSEDLIVHKVSEEDKKGVNEKLDKHLMT